jgi:Leucine-rich repeat (LRR) protein
LLTEAVGGCECHVFSLCSSSLGSKGSELRATAHSNFSQPATTVVFGAEPCLDEQSADAETLVYKKVKASHLLTTRSEGEEQLTTDNEHINWASLSHHTLFEILKQLQWERRASGAFRSVCKEWQEAHDSMVPSLRLKVPLLLPYRLQTKTGFEEVKELDLSSLSVDLTISGLLKSALGSLTGLRRLNLANIKISHFGLFTLGHIMTGLTYLSLARTNVEDTQLEKIIPFLANLTDLDLQGTEVALHYGPFRPHLLASLGALTRLNLSASKVDDEGMQALAPLTALTQLHLDFTAVSDRGFNLLWHLSAHLTHLVLGGEGGYGDPDMIAVSSLTALTRLEMLYNGDGRSNGDTYSSEEGLEALSTLTGLVHLELDLQVFDDNDEGWRALSSLTAVSHLHLGLTSFSDEGANTLACLTALTYLDLSGNRIERNANDFIVSDRGARALASLVRLTYLDLSGSQLHEEGLRALCSLTALTHLDLSFVQFVCPLGNSALAALLLLQGSLPSLSKLCLGYTNLCDEALDVLENSLKSSVQLIC